MSQNEHGGSPRREALFAGSDDRLCEDELERALGGTIFAGKLRLFAQTSSTNDEAMAAARAGAAHGSVFIAEEQTAGRGRSDHGWASTAGEGLYLSALLRLEVAPERLLLVPFAVGLAAMAAIEETAGLEADLRWPNDVLIGAEKVCGILVEARSGARAGETTVVAGVGINVHQRQFPDGMATPATSLELASGRTVDRRELAVRLLESLQRESLELEAEGAGGALAACVEARSSWVRGRRVRVHGPESAVGVTEGLDEHGFLRLRTEAGLITIQTGGLRAVEE